MSDRLLDPPKVFSFSQDDFVQQADNQETALDSLLRTSWTNAQSRGVFRYQLNQGSVPTKIVTPGKLGFVAQLNPERGLLRRKPDDMKSLTMAFSDDRFNFTKITADEQLFVIKDAKDDKSAASVIVNCSPIEYCNSLLVPDLDQKLPQILTEESLKLAISLVCLSGSPYFRAGFNSLGGAASVNHLHWHLYYLEYDLKLEEVVAEGELVKNWPIAGFLFELSEPSSSKIKEVAARVMNVVRKCYANELAYNVFITRARNRKSIRVFFWPRSPEYGSKNDLCIYPAFCEFSGFFLCKKRETYEEIDEDYCIELIKSVAVDDLIHNLR